MSNIQITEFGKLVNKFHSTVFKDGTIPEDWALTDRIVPKQYNELVVLLMENMEKILTYEFSLTLSEYPNMISTVRIVLRCMLMDVIYTEGWDGEL